MMKEDYLKEAALEATEGVLKGDGGPFGAVIVNDKGEIISRGHNSVLSEKVPTAHAEVVAIREACKKLGTHSLEGCTLYSSCEPCPMCLSATIWANIKTIYYGATQKDADDAGFRDELIYEYLAGGTSIISKKELLQEDCQNVLKKYHGEMY